MTGTSLPIITALRLPFGNTSKAQETPFEKRRIEAITNRRKLESDESATNACPIRVQDGPLNSSGDLAADENLHHFGVSLPDGSVWLGDAEAGRFVACIAPPSQFNDNSITLSDDGERCVVFQRSTGSASIFDVRTGEIVARLHSPEQALIQVVVDQYEELIITLDTSGTLASFRLADGESTSVHFPRVELPLAPTRLCKHPLSCRAGRTLVMSEAGKATLIDLTTGVEVAHFGSPSDRVIDGVITDDGDVLFENCDGAVLCGRAPGFEEKRS